MNFSEACVIDGSRKGKQEAVNEGWLVSKHIVYMLKFSKNK